MKNCFLFFLVSLLLLSCARVGSPVGGSKDTIPPKFIGTNLDSSRINIPRNIKELRIEFDEYITLKDINKNLNISPPIKKIKSIIPSNLSTKYLLIKWEDTLQENTTYNFNFGNAIQDNNEANVLPYYNLAFSTGNKIDDLYISGTLKDILKINKQDNSKESSVVGLYQEKDSINYKEKPYYITKVDEDGYYELNYLAKGTYRIIGFNDENGNSIYDPGKERIAFQKNTVRLDSALSKVNLSLFPNKKKLKNKELKEMEGGVLIPFEGNPEDLQVHSISEKLKEYRVTHRKFSDSVMVWFDAKKQNIGQEGTEKLEFIYQNKQKEDTISIFYKNNAKNGMDLKNEVGNLLPPENEFRITSNYIIDKINPQEWTLKQDSITSMNFEAQISKTNPFQILVKAPFKEGSKYQLTVPKGSVSSYYSSNSVSKRFDFEADKIQNYGKFTLHLKNTPKSKFWIQLLDAKEKVVQGKYLKESEIKFEVLQPGEYYLKILVDNNENGFWDQADFEKGIFAEEAFVFYKIVNIRALWDINEDWDLQETRTLDATIKTTPKVSPKLKDLDNLDRLQSGKDLLIPEK